MNSLRSSKMNAREVGAGVCRRIVCDVNAGVNRIFFRQILQAAPVVDGVACQFQMLICALAPIGAGLPPGVSADCAGKIIVAVFRHEQFGDDAVKGFRFSCVFPGRVKNLAGLLQESGHAAGVEFDPFGNVPRRITPVQKQDVFFPPDLFQFARSGLFFCFQKSFHSVGELFPAVGEPFNPSGVPVDGKTPFPIGYFFRPGGCKREET